MSRLLLGGIGLYRRVRRRLLPDLGGVCLYQPTCSRYAETAIGRHGAIAGAVLASWRILRCNPFSSGGYDPVPARTDGRPDRPGTPPDPLAPSDDQSVHQTAHGPVRRYTDQHGLHTQK